jgi:non-heme chloroperoxidase
MSMSGVKRGLALGTAAVSLGMLAAPPIIRRMDHKRSRGTESGPCGPAGGEVIEGIRSRDGTPLHVERCGERGPTIFFVHGWTCSGDIFRHQVAFLRDRYRIITLDLRGHGMSSMPASKDLSTERLAEDLKAVIDAVDPDEFVIAGHSMGGFTTFKFHEFFGKDYEGRLKGLVIIDSTGTDAMEGLYMGRLTSVLYPFPLSNLLRLGGIKSRLSEGVKDWLGRTSYGYMIIRWAAFGKKPPAEIVEWHREITFATPLPVISLALKAIFDYHAEHHLRDVDVPVLVLVGSEDKLTSERTNRRTCELLPDARLVVYRNAGHSTYLERIEEFNAEMDGFLAQCFVGRGVSD